MRENRASENTNENITDQNNFNLTMSFSLKKKINLFIQKDYK